MSDTPKHWKRYLEYQAKLLSELPEATKKFEQEYGKKTDSLPWWKTFFRTGIDKDFATLGFIMQYPDTEPSLIDYYDWDVNIRPGLDWQAKEEHYRNEMERLKK